MPCRPKIVIPDLVTIGMSGGSRKSLNGEELALLERGLIYFGQRYYDPSIGRWITPDPAGVVDGPNLYAYVHNNPLSMTDYFGLASEANASQNKDFLK